MDSGAAVAIGIGVLAVGGVAAFMLLGDQAAGASKPRRRSSGPGWYVLLYNYPPGHRDRKVKAFAGPYEFRDDARIEADREKDVWSPMIRYRKDRPF